MGCINALLLLHERGRSFRQIAAELGIHRETVARHVRLSREGPPKPAKVTTGSSADPDPKPAKVTTGSKRARSLCEEHREEIKEKLEAGLSAIRIHQDLVEERGFRGGYESVKRFVRALKASDPLPFRRMEVLPGAEAQVDFGQGAFVDRGDGKRRRPHLFRIVLSHSRKAYSESVYRQTTESLIRCLENAFHYFGGVPELLVIDNLKAAVTKADWYDPDLNPKFRDFLRHYGIACVPSRPYTPRHKGKIESGINYAQENALKGRTFGSLEEQNRHLRHWESQVADKRIHGTTRKQVQQIFETRERGALRPLPGTRFPFFEEEERKVHRDGHVALKNAFYSVPPEYMTRKVWVRWDSHMIHIYNQRFESIAIHARIEEGRFSTQTKHISSKKISQVEQGADYLLARARRIGPESLRWAQALLTERKVEGLRPLIGFLSLCKKHEARDLERAARTARQQSHYRLKAIRELLREPATERQLEFFETHPLIRDPAVYGALVAAPGRISSHDQEEDQE